MISLLFPENTEGAAEIVFKSAPVLNGNCVITPDARKDVLTLFKIDCLNITQAVKYHLYQKYQISGKEHNILLATETIGNFQAHLGHGEIFVRVFDSTDYYTDINLKVYLITFFGLINIRTPLNFSRYRLAIPQLIFGIM